LHSHGYIGGYYLDGDNADVAVLSVPSFNSKDAQQSQEYQSVAQTFFADAKAAGKKKLIVDLSANGGGVIYLGIDLFKQVSKPFLIKLLPPT
jgi:C-terminal processing protease CtpA/Prc